MTAMQLSLYSTEGPPRPDASILAEREEVAGRVWRAYRAARWHYRKCAAVKAVCPASELALEAGEAAVVLRVTGTVLRAARRRLADARRAVS